jgi:hypothetical protein
MVDDGDVEGVRLSEWLAGLARANWLLVATLAAHALILIVVPSLWSTTVEGHSRSGQSFTMTVASRDLALCGVGTLLYMVAGLGAPRHWAMRPPSAAERTVARWFVRALGLIVMWIALGVALRA